MRVRLLLAAAATLTLAACSASPTAPTPGARKADDVLICRTGYTLATRADGTQECVPE